jgi:hypothetical protein
MVDPKVLIVVLLFAGGYWVGDQAVKGVKKVDVAVAHVGVKTWHGMKHLVGK